MKRLVVVLLVVFLSNNLFSQCAADVGTFTVTATGGDITISGDTIYACANVQSCFSIVSNNDYTLPNGFLSVQDLAPFAPCMTIPALYYAVHLNAAPTTPDPLTDPTWTNLFWTGQDYFDCNLSTFAPFINPGDVLYLIPVTVDDSDYEFPPPQDCGGRAIDQNGDGCYDVGNPFTIFYLDSVIATAVPSVPCDGQVAITVTGGISKQIASTYTVTNMGPGTLSGLPISHNGTFLVEGLQDGDNWSVLVEDSVGCSTTVSGVFVGDVTPPTVFCPSDILSCGSSVITYNPPFATDNCPGLVVINQTSGPASGSVFPVGTTTIGYTVTDFGGNAVACSFDVVISPLDDPSFSYPQGAYCITEGNPVPVISGLVGGTFSMDKGGVIDGITGEVDLVGSDTGDYTITYVTNGSCPDSTTFEMTVTDVAVATIQGVGPFCDGDPQITLSAASGGGVWEGVGITDSVLGTFDPAIAGAGMHTITYTIAGACADEDSITISVNATDDALFSYSKDIYQVGDSNALPQGLAFPGGTFSIDNGGVIDPLTGEINISESDTGSYIITYTTNGPCPAVFTIVLSIQEQLVLLPDFDVSDSAICVGDCIDFTDRSTTNAAEGITDWLWRFDGSVPKTSTDQNPSNVCFTVMGSHYAELVISNSQGSASLGAVIQVKELPTVSIGNSDSIFISRGESVPIETSEIAGATYAWSPSTSLSCADCPAPVANPEETTTYAVTVVDEHGCSATEDVVVVVSEEFKVYVPNTFTPNGDDLNNTFHPFGLSVTSEKFLFRVFDRWGRMIYETDDPNQGWDGYYQGKILMDVYAWKIEYMHNEAFQEIYGSVLLLK